MGVPGVVQPKDFHTSVSADNLPGQVMTRGKCTFSCPGEKKRKDSPEAGEIGVGYTQPPS